MSTYLGCYPAEVVFLMEYARTDSLYDVYWEGSFIREIIEEWPISSDFIRIGLVIYHDTVDEVSLLFINFVTKMLLL